MINKKQKQWRKTSKQSAYRDSGVMETMVKLYGPTSPAGCAVCGNDSLDDLGIHKVDDRPGLQVLWDKCYGVTRQSFDDKLQKQIGRVNV